MRYNLLFFFLNSSKLLFSEQLSPGSPRKKKSLLYYQEEKNLFCASGFLFLASYNRGSVPFLRATSWHVILSCARSKLLNPILHVEVYVVSAAYTYALHRTWGLRVCIFCFTVPFFPSPPRVPPHRYCVEQVSYSKLVLSPTRLPRSCPP